MSFFRKSCPKVSLIIFTKASYRYYLPMSGLLFGFALFSLALTINAHFPLRRYGVLSFASYLAGWLTTELAFHHLVAQLLMTIVLLWQGASDHWLGWLAMAILVISWAGLLTAFHLSRQTGQVLEESLSEGLGESYQAHLQEELQPDSVRPFSPLRLALPFILADPKVQVVRKLPYIPNGLKRNQLDLYRPSAPVVGAPVLLQVHGGGWLFGSNRYQALPLLYHLASRGWICATTNYRLSPRATFPDHIIDIKRAIAWIRKHIHEYGGDPNYIVITGGSAGGHLAALAALTPNDPEYQPGFEDIDTRVRACISFYGIYDLTNQNNHFPQRGLIPFIVEQVVFKKRYRDHSEVFRQASPVYRIHDDAPPFMILHGSQDSVVPVAEARHFAAALRQSSTQPVVYTELPGAQHTFELFHSARASETILGVERFLDYVRSIS